MYCANIARTYLVDPSPQQEEAYKLLLEAQEAAIAALVEGAPMSAAPTAAIDYLTVSSSLYVSLPMIDDHVCSCTAAS
jgi:Xaa-Pro aminopeptidase